MTKFREVDSIFDEVQPFVTDSRSLIDSPYRDGDAFIEGQIVQTLDDGLEVELCLWTDCESHASFWDVSIQKARFDETATVDFLSYLKEKGFYLENIKDRFGGKWHYTGPIDMEKVYRIQYYQDED